MARRQSRDPLERYDTPAWCTEALLEHYPAISGRPVLEPMAGAGAIVDVLERSGGCICAAFDVAPRRADVLAADTAASAFWADGIACNRAVVTNPAFSLAAALWRHASAGGATLIALLLRLTWLEAAAERADIPDPDGLIVLPRPSFIESPEARAIREAAGKKWGGDSCTSAWHIWHPGAPKLGIVRVVRRQRQRRSLLDEPAA